LFSNVMTVRVGFPENRVKLREEPEINPSSQE
jgi:hypothetical protein